MDLEHEWKPDPHNPYWEAFHNQVVALEDRYDYIFFDCPPNVYRATQCGLYSSDEVYVPANPDALSLIGLSLFVEKAVRFHERSSSFRDETPAGRPRSAASSTIRSRPARNNADTPRLQARTPGTAQGEGTRITRARHPSHEIRDEPRSCVAPSPPASRSSSSTTRRSRSRCARTISTSQPTWT
jgi:hypothetical protein